MPAPARFTTPSTPLSASKSTSPEERVPEDVPRFQALTTADETAYVVPLPAQEIDECLADQP